jgi:hypothetical protein
VSDNKNRILREIKQPESARASFIFQGKRLSRARVGFMNPVFFYLLFWCHQNLFFSSSALEIDDENIFLTIRNEFIRAPRAVDSETVHTSRMSSNCYAAEKTASNAFFG